MLHNDNHIVSNIVFLQYLKHTEKKKKFDNVKYEILR